MNHKINDSFLFALKKIYLEKGKKKQPSKQVIKKEKDNV